MSYKLELGICLIIPNVSLKFSPAFQNISRKVVTHQNDVIKYSSSAPVLKKQDSVICKFTKDVTPSQVISKELDHKFKTAILKNTFHIHTQNTYSHGKLCFSQFNTRFIKIEPFVVLTFFLCLHNQLVSIHSIVTH